jgi:hypothetical protein
LKNKIVVAFFVIGMGLSLPGGFLVGNPILNILTYSIISSLILAGLVFGLLTFLESKVPEFVDFLNSVQSGEPMEESNSEENSGDTSSGMENSSDSSPSLGDATPPPKTQEAMGDPSKKNEKPKNGKFGDHIMIDNIPIKNEPKLMAEAIRTMMAQDDPPPSN